VSLARRLLNRVLAPEGEILSFASPRQLLLLLHCSNSCMPDKAGQALHAVEKKVPKEKTTRMPLASCAPRSCALWVFDGGCQKGHLWPSVNAMHPCIAHNGLLTRYIHVPRPSCAAHANRLSCRFVPPKTPVLGATYGGKPAHV